jgi:hypothetical protein
MGQQFSARRAETQFAAGDLSHVVRIQLGCTLGGVTMLVGAIDGDETGQDLKVVPQIGVRIGVEPAFRPSREIFAGSA